ncbi:hypothetical protein BMI89_17960 [Thioclava sp. F36-7]|nr:hypothetical protein BMI89_17960 [Thioclava sp. F36-7]
MGNSYRVDFEHPPELGTKIRVGQQMLTLIAVEPYTRKRDGVTSSLLRWRAEDGRTARSGLRSQNVMWDRGGD